MCLTTTDSDKPFLARIRPRLSRPKPAPSPSHRHHRHHHATPTTDHASGSPVPTMTTAAATNTDTDPAAHQRRPAPTSFLSLPTEIRLKIYRFLFADIAASLTDNLFATFLISDNTYDTTSSHKQACQWTVQGGCARVTMTTWMCRDHGDAMQYLNSRSVFLQPKLLRFFGLSRFELALIQHPRFKAAVDRAAAASAAEAAAVTTNSANNDHDYGHNQPAFRLGTGLTPILSTNRLIASEALDVLCQCAEFVITITGRPEADVGLRDVYTHIKGMDSPHLLLASRIKLNILPYQGLPFENTRALLLPTIPTTATVGSDSAAAEGAPSPNSSSSARPPSPSRASSPFAARYPAGSNNAASTAARLLSRLEAVLDVLALNSKLQCLAVYIDHSCVLFRGVNQDCASRILDRIQSKLGARANRGACRVKIYLGDIPEDALSEERVREAAGAVNGEFLGRGYKVLQPTRLRYKANSASRRLWRV